MLSSPNKSNNLILAVYQDYRTVYRLRDIALLLGEDNFVSINQKLNYYVHTGKLQNPRKGIYTKQDYNPEEMACVLYSPSYISMDYVLQKAGITFQYDSRITVATYLSRSIEVGNQAYGFHKIKGDVLVNTMGIIRQKNHINTACPERAFLDQLYLYPNYFFDSINPLSKELVYQLLTMYQSNEMTKRVNKIFQDV